MNDAAQIRRCSRALCASHLLLPPPDPEISNRGSRPSNRENGVRSQTTASSTCRGGPSVPFTDGPPGFRPFFSLPNPPVCLRSLKNSNREALRLETNVTPTKQTAAIASNREKEALFLTAGRAENRAGLKARPYHGNGERNKKHPSVLLRLKPTPLLCFVGVTYTLNRILLRLNDAFSTPENTAPMQTRTKKTAINAIDTPPNWFRLEPTPIPYFQQLTRNLNDTMFRLEIKKGGKKTKR